MHQLTDTQVRTIAQVAHEANRAYCATLPTDVPPKPWDDLTGEEQASLLGAVSRTITEKPGSPAANHERWRATRVGEGWRQGPLDREKKVHPNLVPYAQLPVAQRRKDALFLAIVQALSAPMTEHADRA